jgi:16S rRNA (guanine966-N2)-methyltransferase
VRIIAGDLGGRRLHGPPGEGTRPMLDRVREALFSTIQTRLQEARVLDLFAGTGSLGLEALSRGAAHALFVESGGPVLRILRTNIKELGLEARAQVRQADALATASYEPRGAEPRYELAFYDPPYALVEDGRGRERVLACARTLLASVLVPDGLLVFHAPRGLLRAADLPGAARERAYGTSSLWYLEPVGPAAAEVSA